MNEENEFHRHGVTCSKSQIKEIANQEKKQPLLNPGLYF